MGENSHLAEEILDRIILFAILLAAACFALYGRREIERSYVEREAEKLLKQSSASGVLFGEDYGRLVEKLACLEGRYELELRHTYWMEYPVYRCYSVAELAECDAERNVRIRKELKPWQLHFTEPVTEKLQTESNATLFGKTALPLPQENQSTDYLEAVRPVQSIYEGEGLVTLCYAYGPYGVYIAEAGKVYPPESGTVELKAEGIDMTAEVKVTVYPRTLSCINGHSYGNTKERIEYLEQHGTMPVCPYCMRTAEHLEISPTVITTTTGTEISKLGLVAEVVYADGHKAEVTPDDDGWQDDYDEFYCGMQTVTVSYQGSAPCYITVVSEGRLCQVCGQCCTNKNYTEYQKFPVCNQCQSTIPKYTGTVSYAEVITGKQEILAALENEGNYLMERGSMLQLVIKEGGKEIYTGTEEILGRAER